MAIERKTVIFYDERHISHQTRKEDPCEIGERVELIKSVIENSNLDVIWCKPKVREPQVIYKTHLPAMLDSLKRYSGFAEPGDEIFTRYYAVGDSFRSTPITRGTYEQALLAACSAIDAGNMINNQVTKLTFSLSRPPGHHAGREFYHGFCFMNNAALAARTIRAKDQKVAILDFDIHHGDGTQDIFYNTGEVLFISLHVNPNFISSHTGFPNEQGEGKSKGMIVNMPLEAGISVGAYRKRFDEAINLLGNYKPNAIVVSAGFDAHKNDFPPGGESLTQLSDEDFGYLGEKLGTLDIPTCVVLEGGYNLKHLSDSVLAFLTSLEKRLIKRRKTL